MTFDFSDLITTKGSFQRVEGVLSRIQEEAYQAFRSVDSSPHIANSSKQTELPALEIYSKSFQKPEADSKENKRENASQPPLDSPGSPADSPVLQDTNASCLIRDSRFEQNIQRDADGRIQHSGKEYPSYKYDEKGNLSEVNLGGGTIGKYILGNVFGDIFSDTVYKRRPDGKWVVNGVDGKVVEDVDFDLNQQTGELIARHRESNMIIHRNADGTSYREDSTGRVLSTNNGSEQRFFKYDSEGRLKEVGFYNSGGLLRRDQWQDSWTRQEDGTWANIKDGKPTGRVLKNIEVAQDGTYIETEFPCKVNVFRLEQKSKPNG